MVMTRPNRRATNKAGVYFFLLHTRGKRERPGERERGKEERVMRENDKTVITQYYIVINVAIK